MTRFLTMPILYCLLAAAALLGGLAAFQTLRLANEKADHQQDLAEHAAVLANIAGLTAKASEEYRALERAGEVATNEARTARQKEIDDGKAENERLVAAVAAGDRKLRNIWTSAVCPAASESNPDAADRAGEGAALLQAESLGRIAGTLDEADSRLRFLLKREEIWQRVCPGALR